MVMPVRRVESSFRPHGEDKAIMIEGLGGHWQIVREQIRDAGYFDACQCFGSTGRVITESILELGRNWPEAQS